MDQEQIEQQAKEKLTEAEKWDELLHTLVGENVKVRFRIEYDPHGATLQGRLTQHLTGGWRIHMPAGEIQDPRNPQGPPMSVPAQEFYFMSEAVALVVTLPKVSILGQG